MANEPGNLSDLEGAGKDEWDRYVSNSTKEAISASGTMQFLAESDDSITSPPPPRSGKMSPLSIAHPGA